MIETECARCGEPIYEDGIENWCHASDGARFCDRPDLDPEDPAKAAEPVRCLNCTEPLGWSAFRGYWIHARSGHWGCPDDSGCHAQTRQGVGA